jgi:hypothetical protein
MSKTIPFELRERWRVAKHEAGHTVAAHALGGKPWTLEIGTTGQGLARHSVALGAWDTAIVHAAGPEGEAMDFPLPVVAPAHDPALPPPPASFLETQDFLTCAPDLVAQVECDHRVIALMAIAGCEHEPDRWAGRANRLHYEARRILRYFHDEHLRLSERLFVRGIVCPSEIEIILPPPPAATTIAAST